MAIRRRGLIPGGPAVRRAGRAGRGIALAALLTALVGAACAKDDGSGFNPIRDFAEVSLDEERELGLQFDRALREQVSVIDDPVVSGFINELGQSIVSQVSPQPFIYRFRVIVDPSLNAFAVPGGYVYFHSGTILEAGSVDELAGVMGHEIAHVKGHHYARMRQKTQIPDLLTSLAGAAAAVATREPGLLVLAQGVNVAVGLKFSRQMETEADHLGAIWLTRAGYDPGGITRFFQRLLEKRRDTPTQIPPYLFSHPDVEERIAAVQQEAASLRPPTPPAGAPDERDPDRGLSASLPEVQQRLRQLIATRRTSLPLPVPAADTSRSDPLLRSAEERVQAGEIDAALLSLARAEQAEPHDPRVPFRIGELLERQARFAEAAQAYRRTIRLDASRAQVFYKLGMVYQRVGDRQRAVYAFEQAALRLGPASELRRRVDWQIEKLTFGILPRAGLADGAAPAEPPVEMDRSHFPLGTRRIVWWGELHPRFASYVPVLRVRWLDPEGTLVKETAAQRNRRPFVRSLLDLGEGGARPAGTWRVEVLIEGDVIDRRSFEVGP